MNDNTLRYGKGRRGGHVESFFLRANHPQRPLALWLKATVLAPAKGSPLAELWFISFDGERGRTLARRERMPLDAALFSDDPARIELANASFCLAPQGHARGSIATTEPGSGCSWDLSFVAPQSPLSEPLCIFPASWMLRAPWPRFKLVTPLPLLRFDGSATFWGETIDVEGWYGTQGHNWGREHTHRYVWGQCHFMDATGAPLCSVEATSARLKVAGLVTPPLSLMVIRRGEREYRFDRLVSAWRHHAQIGELSWTLEARGRAGRARLEMSALAERVAQLGYENPDGKLSYCANSKLASAHLRVDPVNEPSFFCSSAHGGALELLAPEPHPAIAEVA